MSTDNQAPKVYWSKHKLGSYRRRQLLHVSAPGSVCVAATPYFVDTVERTYLRHHPDHKHMLFGSGMGEHGGAECLATHSRVAVLMARAEQMALNING